MKNNGIFSAAQAARAGEGRCGCDVAVPYKEGHSSPCRGSGGALLALPHGLEHGFPKILEPEDQLQVHPAGLHHLGRKGGVNSWERGWEPLGNGMGTPGKWDGRKLPGNSPFTPPSTTWLSSPLSASHHSFQLSPSLSFHLFSFSPLCHREDFPSASLPLLHPLGTFSSLPSRNQ